jgi:hypothetical protein
VSLGASGACTFSLDGADVGVFDPELNQTGVIQGAYFNESIPYAAHQLRVSPAPGVIVEFDSVTYGCVVAP